MFLYHFRVPFIPIYAVYFCIIICGLHSNTGENEKQEGKKRRRHRQTVAMPGGPLPHCGAENSSHAVLIVLHVFLERGKPSRVKYLGLQMAQLDCIQAAAIARRGHNKNVKATAQCFKNARPPQTVWHSLKQATAM